VLVRNTVSVNHAPRSRKKQPGLTAAMEIQFHKSNRTMNAIIIRILVSKFSNPREIGLVQMLLEESETVFKNRSGIVFVKC
jgi:hypothetical protein